MGGMRGVLRGGVDRYKYIICEGWIVFCWRVDVKMCLSGGCCEYVFVYNFR
jgi:hypothetical protein